MPMDRYRLAAADFNASTCFVDGLVEIYVHPSKLLLIPSAS